MTSSPWPVPFILTPQTLQIDAVVTFCVSILLATMINAEAQAFAATFLGDSRKDPKDRFNFNVFLHLDILGTICYLVGGFGWPRKVEVDGGKFKHPRAYTVIVRGVGPLANLMLAGIAGSLVVIFNKFETDPRVFLMVAGVNVTTAIYNLIILPPLAAGVLVQELIPPRLVTLRQIFRQAGPFLILALALLDRLTPGGIVSPYLNPLVMRVFDYIRG
jgi:Zn-dependent protease